MASLSLFYFRYIHTSIFHPYCSNKALGCTGFRSVPYAHFCTMRQGWSPPISSRAAARLTSVISSHAFDISLKISVVFLNVLFVTLSYKKKGSGHFCLILQFHIKIIFAEQTIPSFLLHFKKQEACVCRIITYTAVVVTEFSSMFISFIIIFCISSNDKVYGSLIIFHIFTSNFKL